jgi:hypothetical protein
MRGINTVKHRFTVALSILALLLVTVACTSQPDAASQQATPDSGKLEPIITTSELVVGTNRFGFGLRKGSRLIENAEVIVRSYEILGNQAKLRAEGKAIYHKLEVVDQSNAIHVHPDGSQHVHTGEAQAQGVYAVQLTFDRAGTWGLEVVEQEAGKPPEANTFAITVLDAPRTPAVGSPAPRSRNLIASDVDGDVSNIDTSVPPDPRLHQVRIADMIDQGRPQLIIFATPKFCTSQVCGPVVDVVRTLMPAYSDKVAFIHQEIWEDFGTKDVFDTVDEWNLQSEPWVFLVDSQGLVRAKFEGLTTAKEIEEALKQMLAQS